VSNVTAAYNDPNDLKTSSYIVWGIAAISLIVLYFLWDRIRLAIAIIKASAEFVEETPNILSVPPLMFFVLLAYYIYWIWILLYILSSGSVHANDSGLPFAQVAWTTESTAFFWVHLFGLLWNNFILITIPQFVVMSAVCIWYFSGSKTTDPVSKSIWRTFRYHFGSIVFGSLILALVFFVRALLSTIAHVGRKNKEKTIAVAIRALNLLKAV